ncbi:methyltransferase domain-containing protein [Vagococcus coleopterorum]|uniref:Methyltransferase domain-containing protein n=1 Tax=Vagococcus coleopterorum TaxID=2714946 RepID=A0A6G8AM33_9ENTE|nr:class I SAM-dependent methyltransferase [Vagococcus coleopterorum]QIL46057.1 methyltransferase domain-containing protein [Vagococcus coleopterorum]
MLIPSVKYSHTLLKEIIKPGDTVVDATVGNGFDTLFLAELVGTDGTVIGFDIQAQAIETTLMKLKDTQLDKQVSLYQQGHETVSSVISKEDKIKAAIFNLGYLPKADKNIITQGPTTIQAIETLMEHLTPLGRIIIVVYYGHQGGPEEKNQVMEFVKTIPQSHFNVLSYQFINQKNQPPILLAIEKKAKVNAP